MKFGRNRPHPADVERQPRFRAFRTPAPLLVPDGWDWGALCAPALATMLANGPDPSAPPQVAKTGVGCCTCAAVGHAVDIWSAGGASPVTITAAQVVRLYELACGYVMGNASTDQGGNELAVLQYVATHGIDGNGLHQIAGVAALDATNLQEMREGLFLTGAAALCLELPDAYLNAPLNPDTVWDVVGPGNPKQGHCILAKAYTTNGPTGKPSWGVVSWGKIVWLTADACATYCAERAGGGAYVGLTREWMSNATSTAPNALDWAGLAATFQQLGGVLS